MFIINYKMESKKIEEQKEKIDSLKVKNAVLKEKVKYFDSTFRSELKNSVRTAILAAFSFLIALQWRELITETIKKISSESPLQGLFFSTVVVTLLCVLGIVLTSQILSNKKDIEKK